ncbi:MAG TPA: response regulator [Flavobacterium sp.]|nr:response regulator [Flavobacterium sp.]
MQQISQIYIIDDDDIFVFVLKKLLQKTKRFHDIIDVRNGSEAIELLTVQHAANAKLPELIFLDLNMPILDGWQFLDEVEKLPFKDELKIYIISSSIDPKEIEKSKEYSTVRSFVSKPVTMEWLHKISG